MRNNNTTIKVLYYLPRVLGILAILFISTFALDVFEEGQSFSQVLIGLFMHLVPSFVLIAILTVAWKFERAGGSLFILISLTPFFLLSNEIWINALLATPFFVTGILFIVHAQITSNMYHD